MAAYFFIAFLRSSVAIIEAFMHSFGLVLGAGLPLICEGIAQLEMGKMGVKLGIPGARRTR